MKTTKARNRKRAAAVACTDLLGALAEIFDQRANEWSFREGIRNAESSEALHGDVRAMLRDIATDLHRLAEHSTGCTVQGCKRKAIAAGQCGVHFRRYIRKVNKWLKTWPAPNTERSHGETETKL